MENTQPVVVIVEDDKFISKAYANGLTKAGFTVHVAYDGVQGIKKIDAHNPDIVLLDLIMPKKDGFQVLEILRANAATADLPVIVLSNLGQEEDIERANRLGANSYFVKADHSLHDIIDVVHEHINTPMRMMASEN